MQSKKFKIGLIVFLLIALGGFLFWVYFKKEISQFFGALNQEISQIEKTPIESLKEPIESLINEIEKQVSAPPPLRLPESEEAPQSFLTKAGVIKWTNFERTSHSLAVLKENTKLNAAALAKAQDMFKNQYFAHESLAGAGPVDLATKAGYDFLAVGENLAMGNFADDQALVEAWMASPGHQANILNPKFQEIGVAVIQGIFEGKKTWLAVQEFGLPASACPPPDEKLRQRLENYIVQAQDLENLLAVRRLELENMPPRRNPEYIEKVNQYNELVGQYNAIVAIIKTLINQYNNQVNLYNQCIK